MSEKELNLSNAIEIDAGDAQPFDETEAYEQLFRQGRKVRRQLLKSMGLLPSVEHITDGYWVQRVKANIPAGLEMHRRNRQENKRTTDLRREQRDEAILQRLIKTYGEERGLAMFEKNIEIENNRVEELAQRKARKNS